MNYTRTTISIPEHVLELGQQRAAQFRLSFSEFVARLVEEEARLQRKSLTLVAEESAEYTISAKAEHASKLAAKVSKAKKRQRQATRKHAA